MCGEVVNALSGSPYHHHLLAAPGPYESPLRWARLVMEDVEPSSLRKSRIGAAVGAFDDRVNISTRRFVETHSATIAHGVPPAYVYGE